MSKTRRALLILLGLALLLRPVEVVLSAMLPDAAVNPVPQCVAGMLAALLMFGLPAWLLRPWTSPRLMRRNSLWTGLIVGCLSGWLVRAAMPPVDAAWQAWLNLTPDALPVPENVPLAMLYIAALAIVPAVTEEAFFRGAVLTGLLDGSRRLTAVLLTTVCFALMHGNAANLPSLLALSLLLTLLMLHTGRAAVPMTAHLVYNLTALNWEQLPGWGSILCGAGLIALAAYIVACQPKVAHPPMKRPDGLIAAATVAVLAVANMI